MSTVTGIGAATDSATQNEPTPGTAVTTAGATTPTTGVLVYVPVNAAFASVDVEIFGETVTTTNRIVYSQSQALTAADLGSFIQYAESSANRDDVVISTTSAGLTACQTSLATVADEPVDLDTNYADWWKDGAVTVQNSTRYLHFGSLAEFLLAQIAYDVLGHPMAKAGIANDTAIIDNFVSSGPTGVAAAVVNAIDAAANTKANSSPGSGSLRLAYQQLFKQVPGRFQVQDSTAGSGNAANPNTDDTLPKDMPFEAGDRIRFEITLDNYNVRTFNTTSNPTTASGNGLDSATGVNMGVTAGANSGLQYTTYGRNTYTLDLVLA